jgi:hypothetical protein
MPKVERRLDEKGSQKYVCHRSFLYFDLPQALLSLETFEFMIKSPCRHSVLDLNLPRTRYGGTQCFQAVIDSAPIFIGVTRRNDVRGRFSKVSPFQSVYFGVFLA